MVSGSDSFKVAAPVRDSRDSVVFDVFCATHAPAWAAFARARGLTAAQAEEITATMRKRLWRCRAEVMSSQVPAAEAWRLLKEEIALATRHAPDAVPEPAWKEAIRAALERMRINMKGVWISEYGTYETVLALPERQQEAVILHYMLELPYATIAEYLDATEQSVRANAHHGVKRLEQKLQRGSR